MLNTAPPQWFVSRNKKQYGPFSADRLKALVSAKKLLLDDIVCQQDTSNWVAATSLTWLFPPDDDPSANAPANPAPETIPEMSDVLDLGGRADEQLGPLSMKGIRVRPDFTLTYGDFQLLRKLGTGGMGAVYLALQRSKSRRVALKMLSGEFAQRPSFIKRFYREALILGSLEHTNIVKGYGVGEEAGIPFLAMEYVDGFSAAQVLRQVGRLDVGDALLIILRCAEALGYGHSQDIIHRDVTPANVLITRKRIVKVSDFGLAKPTNEEVSKDTESSITLGTPKYMSPEQTLNSKHADWRSDIYSLGSMLYHFVTGQLPFHGETSMELLKAKDVGQFTAARRLNDNVPTRLDLIIDRMLAKDPRKRPQSCAELIREIECLGVHNARLSFGLDKLRTKTPNAASAEREKIEILMIQAELTEVRLAQEVLKQQRLAAHVYVAGSTLNAINYLRRKGANFSSAPRPHLIVFGRNVTPDGSLAVLNEMKTLSLANLPVAVLATRPEAAWELFQMHGLLDSVFVFAHEDREMLSEVLESVRDIGSTQAE